MGMGFLDLSYRLKKRLGFAVPWEAWAEIVRGRDPVDITAGEVCAAIEAMLGPHRMRQQPPAPAGPPGPSVLHYHQQGPQWAGTSNELWFTVRHVIAETVSVPPDRILRETWLVRELGLG